MPRQYATAMWNGLSALDERVAFKRIGSGYVFRAPSRALFGPSRHFLVDAAGKDRITTVLADMRAQRARIFMVVLLVLMSAAAGTVIFLRGQLLAAALACGVLLMGAIALVRFREARTLQPLLAGLPPTAERITWRERLVAASGATPYKQLLILGLSFAVIGIANALELIECMHRAGCIELSLRLAVRATAVMFFGSLAAANFTMLALKMKRQPVA